MSKRRVEKVAPVSATSSSVAVDIGQTTSILSDPDGRWIAKRQSAITAAFEHRTPDQADPCGDDRGISLDRSRFKSIRETAKADLSEEGPRRLSGESGRIGKGNWGESTPFGKRVGYL